MPFAVAEVVFEAVETVKVSDFDSADAPSPSERRAESRENSDPRGNITQPRTRKPGVRKYFHSLRSLDSSGC